MAKVAAVMTAAVREAVARAAAKVAAWRGRQRRWRR